MGGKKKRSLKQQAKSQIKKPPKKGKGKAKATPAAVEQKGVPGITPPNVQSDKFLKDLKKMKVVTPNTIASRYSLRLSVARALIKELERKGLIQFVSRSRHLTVHTPAN